MHVTSASRRSRGRAPTARAACGFRAQRPAGLLSPNSSSLRRRLRAASPAFSSIRRAASRSAPSAARFGSLSIDFDAAVLVSAFLVGGVFGDFTGMMARVATTQDEGSLEWRQFTGSIHKNALPSQRVDDHQDVCRRDSIHGSAINSVDVKTDTGQCSPDRASRPAVC